MKSKNEVGDKTQVQLRAYSIRELDDLRETCETRWLYGTTEVGRRGGLSRTYSGAEKDKAVEEVVRTHMLAGHTAQDIRNEDKAKHA